MVLLFTVALLAGGVAIELIGVAAGWIVFVGVLVGGAMLRRRREAW